MKFCDTADYKSALRECCRSFGVGSFGELLGGDKEHGANKESLANEVQSNTCPNSIIAGLKASLAKDPQAADEAKQGRDDGGDWCECFHGEVVFGVCCRLGVIGVHV